MVKYLAAYALVALKETPTKASVEAVLKAGGVAVDSARMDELFAQFEGKDFAEVSKEGKAKIGSGGGGGGGGGAAAAAPAAAAAAAPAAAAKKPEPEEESEGEMMDLF